jgi:hypothetical protein
MLNSEKSIAASWQEYTLTEQVIVVVAVMIFIRDVADSILDRKTSYPEVSGFSQSLQANPAVTTPSDHVHFSVFTMRHTPQTLPLRYNV